MSVLELSEYAYHADMVDADRPSLSRSVIQQMVHKSPAHARAAHPKLNPLWEPDEKKAFDVGKVCHQLLLDGTAGVQIIHADNWKSPKTREKAAEARAHGLVPLLEHEWEKVDAMMSAVRGQVGDLFDGGDSELSLVWEESGVLCRARIDWLSDDRRMIRDFKTSSDAEPVKFSKGSFLSYGYDLQDAWYRRGVRATFGTEPDYELVVAEKDAPYQCIVFDSAPDTLALANVMIDWALLKWKECLESGEWPGYPARTHSVTLPPWREEQWWARFQGAAA